MQETPRPEYASLCPAMEKNPVTGVKEPYFPERDRIPRIMSGVAAIIIMVSYIHFHGSIVNIHLFVTFAVL